jgi:hypothetical protein
MRKLLAALVFATLSPIAGYATECNSLITDHCTCLLRHLDVHLGESEARFLLKVWEQSMSSDSNEREKFFQGENERVNEVILRYGSLKSLLLMQCGTLNLPSDGMD